MTIKATFIGKNGSLGYVTYAIYELKVKQRGFTFIIERMDGSGKCPYGSTVAFLKNWTNIKTTKS